MLQISTGMYFRDGIPINETTHRAAFYTNGSLLDREAIDLPIGRFTFATGIEAVTAVMIEVVDRLEAERPDGKSEMMVATGGSELLDDAATVLAFAANITCARPLSLVERAVPADLDSRPRQVPSSMLRRTFDPRIVLTDTDVERVRTFTAKLLAQHRPHFEAAMRAIRTVVDATFLVAEDPSLAYTLLVATLESLAQHATAPEHERNWDTYDSRKRKILDEALVVLDLEVDQADRIREAVLEADQLSLSRRFRAFTLDHIRPSFYREEARGALRPIRAHDLPHALKIAYRLRSRNVHELRTLAPELWAMPDRADTLRFEGRPILSLEGLTRLARHIITTFVDRSPNDLDTSFHYREHLPGIVQMPLAPQYWIARAHGFNAESAPNYLQGLLEILLSSEPSTQLPDLTAVLEKIEQLLPGENDPDKRRPMVAIYVLWNLLLAPEHRRPNADDLIVRFRSDLDEATPAGYAAHVLTSRPLEWDTADLLGLVERRRDELRRGKGQPLPARLDSALLLETARRLWDEGEGSKANELIAEAVESLPGVAALVELESLALAEDGATSDGLTSFDALSFARAEWELESDGGNPEDADDGHDEEA